MLSDSAGCLPLHWRAKRYEADVDVDGMLTRPGDVYKSREGREVLYEVV